MKKSLLISFMFVCPTIVWASHIMGGEITYKHLRDLQYRVMVTIYRDCNGCKLMGAGGGDSTRDCGSFNLFLATSSNSSCGRVDLEKIAITRTSIKEILPVCNGYTTKCSKNGNLPYGVEAHIFEGEVDFSNYTSYKGCSFDFYTSISWRTNGLSTINDDQAFYNFARINPWVSNSSPLLSNYSQPILFCQQPLYYNLSAADPDGDSLSYELVSALADFNKSVNYKSGFNGKKPLDVHCTGDCTPDQTSTPPVGIYLSPETGNLVFTPTKCGQNAVIVMEVTKWRKINGTYTIIGIVRRDLQYIVNNKGQNNSPVISISNSKKYICEGEELCFDIDVRDIPFQFLDSTYAAQDSVKISWSNNISGVVFSMVPGSSGSNFKAEFCWRPKIGEANQLPFQFTVYANDGNCPLNALAASNFEIFVKPAPKAKLSILKKNCDWILVEDLLKQADITNHVWTVSKTGDPSFRVASNDASPIFKLNGAGKYYVSLLVKNSLNCTHVFTDSITINTSELKAFDISAIGKTVICEGDTLSLSAVINNGYSWLSTEWRINNLVISKENELIIKSDANVHSGLYNLLVTGTKEGFICKDSIPVNILVNQKPIISSISDPEFCQIGSGLNKLFEIVPIGGIWSTSNSKIIAGSDYIDEAKLDRNIDQILCFNYVFQDKVTGCISTIEKCLTAKALPVLEAKDIVACKGMGVFWLDNLIEKPSSFAARNLKWNTESMGIYPFYDPGVGRFNINPALLANGPYQVIVTNTRSNGCYITDTSYLTILDKVEITFDNPKSLCGGQELDLNEILNVFPKGGGWYCANDPSWISNNKLTAQACGTAMLTYTYDNYSCYDRKSIEILIECQPEINFVSNIDSICENYGLVNLIAEPAGGVWTGQHISGTQFNPSGLRGQYNLNYELKGSVCSKSKNMLVTVIDSPFVGFSHLVDQSCEGGKIDLSGIIFKTANGEITFGSGSVETDDEMKKFLFYNPSASEILKGEVRFIARVAATNYCPEFFREYPIKIIQKPKFEFANALEGCQPFKARFNHSADLANNRISNYHWNFDDSLSGSSNFSGLSQPNHQFEFEGNYSPFLNIRTTEGCTFIYTFTDKVLIHPSPVALFETMPNEFASMIDPKFHFINKSVGANSYYWDFGTDKNPGTSIEVSPIFTYPGDTGNFLVTLIATNEFECSDEFSKWLNVGSDLIIHIPNAFSPNKKGPNTNNAYKVVGTNISVFEIVIVNRWGEVVFSSKDINKEWDGTTGGEVCLPGVYVYQINVVSKTGVEYKYGGTINLLR